MTRLTKSIRRTVSILAALVLLSVTTLTASAVSTEVYFTVEKSTIANMYYQVIENGEPITEDLTFEIIDADTGQVITTVSTEDSVLFVPDVPFGEYIVRLVDGSDREYHIRIDTEYLLTAHEKKDLDITERSGGTAVATGDGINLLPLAGLLMVSACALMFVSRRKEDECGEE